MIRRALFFACSEGFEAVVPFLLFPILTQSLSSEQYGLWVMYVATHSLARPFVGLSLQEALRVRFSEIREDLVSYISQGVLASLAMTVVFLVGANIFADMLSGLTSLPLLGIIGALVTAFLQSFFYVILAVFQFTERRAVYVGTVATYVGLSLVGTLGGIYLWESWLCAVVARIIGLGAAGFVGYLLLRGFSLPKIPMPSSQGWYHFFSFGLFYLPAGLSPLLVPFITRALIAAFISVSEVGLAGVAMLFGSVILLGCNAFRLAIQPSLFAAIKERNLPIIRHTIVFSVGFFGVVFLSIGLITLAAHFLIPILSTPSFERAIAYVPLFCLAAWAQGIFEHSTTFLQGFKKISLISKLQTTLLIGSPAFQLLGAFNGSITWIVCALIACYIAAFLFSVSKLWRFHGEISNQVVPVA